MRFSQRMGITPSEKLAQIESVDQELTNSLWSLLTFYYWETFDKYRYDIGGHRSDFIRGSNLSNLFINLWMHFFKDPIDTIPEYFYDSKGGLAWLRAYFFEADWHEVYDFIEFIAEFGPESTQEEFISVVNKCLERENSGYRFVNGTIVEITSQEEIEEVEQAISSSAPYFGVKTHLKTALGLLSDKSNPDYRNSIKESISAVESLCREMSGNDRVTLGVALNALEKNGVLHPALNKAFGALYGFTSDSAGIRHSLMEESNLNKADAKFMLVSCSAFVNYVISAL